MLIRNAEIDARLTDVRLVNGRIAEIGADLQLEPGEQMIDAAGGALLPGLHDHHLHLNAAAAARLSVRCGPPEVTSAEALAAALAAAPGDGWVRGVGYHESVAGDIDRNWLDRFGPDRPVRVQHRGGRMWVLNSAAIDLLGGAAPADGRLVDADEYVRLMRESAAPDSAAPGATPLSLGPLVRELLSWGVTGVTDATPRNDADDFRRYCVEAAPLRLSIMGGAGLDDLAPNDDAVVGPVKFHYHDYDLPPLDVFAAEVARAHDAGRPVAVHCVTLAELMLALGAIEGAGVHPGDRIEHAAIAPDASIEWISRLGVTVVANPAFLTERAAAYRRDVPSHDHPYLWRLKSFHTAGVRLAAGSDAPFAGLNPWRAMAAAVERPEGFGEDEAASPELALAMFTKPAEAADAAPRVIEAGAAADLCLLTRPWSTVRENLAGAVVRATFRNGVVVYDSMASTSPH